MWDDEEEVLFLTDSQNRKYLINFHYLDQPCLQLISAFFGFTDKLAAARLLHDSQVCLFTNGAIDYKIIRVKWTLSCILKGIGLVIINQNPIIALVRSN